MAKKSSKTAHVLNLLTASEERDAPAGKASAKDIAEEASSLVNTGKIGKTAVQERSADSASLADIIRRKLEREFESASYKHMSHLRGQAYTPNISDENREYVPYHYISVNVMEELVSEKSPEFVKKMGGCTCYRCISDVIAIALNMLPAQYIVVPKELMLSKISFYENQYMSELTAALTKACNKVKNSPRH